jgi:hypothetical protein
MSQPPAFSGISEFSVHRPCWSASTTLVGMKSALPTGIDLPVGNSSALPTGIYLPVGIDSSGQHRLY